MVGDRASQHDGEGDDHALANRWGAGCERPPHGRLVIRFLPRGEIGEYDALLVEQARDASEVGPLSRLSRREQEVLRWVSRGKTNPQIAATLSISAGTVQKHLEHIYDKPGVRTRAAAAVALAGGAASAP
jgi:DNA-binding CsgD family transcriptional regulator